MTWHHMVSISWRDIGMSTFPIMAREVKFGWNGPKFQGSWRPKPMNLAATVPFPTRGNLLASPGQVGGGGTALAPPAARFGRIS